MTNVKEFLSKAGTITLCGSTRFYEAYVAANRLLTLKGWTVLSCGQFGHSYHKEVAGEIPLAKIKALHFWKIMQSDAICIVNGNQYLGKSSKLEIDFAIKNDKSIIEFEATSLHDGIFEVIDTRPQVYPTLDEFLLSETWQKFTQINPNFY
jgi:hypothetical protein